MDIHRKPVDFDYRCFLEKTVTSYNSANLSKYKKEYDIELAKKDKEIEELKERLNAIHHD